jgi:hypothetical protein
MLRNWPAKLRQDRWQQEALIFALSLPMKYRKFIPWHCGPLVMQTVQIEVQ